MADPCNRVLNLTPGKRPLRVRRKFLYDSELEVSIEGAGSFFISEIIHQDSKRRLRGTRAAVSPRDSCGRVIDEVLALLHRIGRLARLEYLDVADVAALS